MKLFETDADLNGYLFRITDNGGKSVDRFTIITSDGDYFGSSGAPFHPQGFFQSGEMIDVQGVQERVESGEEHDLRWIDLPEDVRRATIGRLNDGWEDWLDHLAAECPEGREGAKSNEGIHDSAGVGLYHTDAGYFVRKENAYPDTDPDGDLGPYATIREAMLASLPDEYSLAGPEYQTTRDLWSEEGGPAPLWDADEEQEEGDAD